MSAVLPRVVAVASLVAVAAVVTGGTSSARSPADAGGDDSEVPERGVYTVPRQLPSAPILGVASAADLPTDQLIGDPLGDVALPPGDITGASVSTAIDGSVFLWVKVRQFTDPSSDASWISGATFVQWELDFDLDGVIDVRVRLGLGGIARTEVVLLSTPQSELCAPTPNWTESAAAYHVRIPASCLDSPSRFLWAAGMTYDNLAGVVTTDWAPDATWSGPVANAGSSPIVTLAPVRLYDSRRRDGPRPSGSITTVQVSGQAAVPSLAKGAILNVTAVDARAPGFMTVFPCDVEVPPGSNVNYSTGETVPNTVFAPLSADGRVCVYTFGAAGLIVDVNGYIPQWSDLEPVPGERIYDSRDGDGPVADGSVAMFWPYEPIGASTLILNVTAVDARSNGFMTVFPCDSATVPNASNLNFFAGQTRANAVVADLTPAEEFCVSTEGSADLVVDLNGLLPVGSRLFSFPPMRMYDSRWYGGPRPAGSITEVQVVGGHVPEHARTVMLNVTVDQTDAPGFVTIFPCGHPLPEASNLNYVAGDTVANAVVAKVGGGGRICVYTYASANVIVDVSAYVP